MDEIGSEQSEPGCSKVTSEMECTNEAQENATTELECIDETQKNASKLECINETQENVSEMECTNEAQENDPNKMDQTKTDQATQMKVKKLSNTRSILVEETCQTKVDRRGRRKKPVPKRSLARFKVIGDEVMYKTDTPRMAKMMANRNPTVIQRRYLKQVIKKMQDVKNSRPKKRQHKLFEQYGELGEMVLLRCTKPSVEKIINNFSPISAYRCTIDTMFQRIRSAMLDHNWDHCFRLYERLLQLKGLNRYHAIYLLRVIIVGVFNSNVGGDKLDKFLRITFGLSEESSRRKFLRSLFVLPAQLKGPRVHSARTFRMQNIVKEELEDPSPDEDEL